MDGWIISAFWLDSLRANSWGWRRDLQARVAGAIPHAPAQCRSPSPCVLLICSHGHIHSSVERARHLDGGWDCHHFRGFSPRPTPKRGHGIRDVRFITSASTITVVCIVPVGGRLRLLCGGGRKHRLLCGDARDHLWFETRSGGVVFLLFSGGWLPLLNQDVMPIDITFPTPPSN